MADDSDSVTYGTTTRGRDGVLRTQAPLTPVDDQREKNVQLHTPWVIPIVFLPGIMGSNLKQGDQTAWRPPNTDIRGAGHAIATLFTFLFRNAEDRGKLLDKDKVQVDHGGSIDTAGSGLSEQQARDRGWGSVMRGSYHPLMGMLEDVLNRIAEAGKLAPAWRDGGPEGYAGDPRDWGALGELPALSEADVRHAARYRFEVWGAGYNWLQSNRDSGAAVRDYIDGTVLAHYRKHQMVAEKVIVVTHSMGGMVSRALTEIHQCEQVLGVVHGVQPATGAPATYKRMRAGFEGMAKVVLGRNAAEVMAVLANAPGGLELLPTADYNGGKPWLKVIDTDRPDQPLMALPATGDPYGEIYTSTAWYGLIPEGAWGRRGKPAALPSPHKKLLSTQSLDEIVEAVRQFHLAIAGRYKVPTYAHHGAQGTRDTAHGRGGLFGTGIFAGSNRNAWGEIAWIGEKLGNLDPMTLPTVQDDEHGRLTLPNGIELRIAAPDVPGDGTVPEPSGAAPTRAGIAGCFAHGQNQSGVSNEAFGYDHQDSYNDPRARYATIYGILKIARLASWRPH